MCLIRTGDGRKRAQWQCFIHMQQLLCVREMCVWEYVCVCVCVCVRVWSYRSIIDGLTGLPSHAGGGGVSVGGVGGADARMRRCRINIQSVGSSVSSTCGAYFCFFFFF